MFKKEELEHARAIIDSLIEITPDQPKRWDQITLTQKLNRLSELIDALRFDGGLLDDEHHLTTFRPKQLFADPSTGKIHFVDGGSSEGLEPYASKKLVLPLLDYLATHPGKGRPVLSIIRSFVREYLPRCHIRDFQRTATGVIRIETNLRFAAAELRRMGLLQYTQVEAFKTWRLSLIGILAAENFSNAIALGEKTGVVWIGNILRRLEAIKNLENLISRLEGIAKPARVAWSEKSKFLALTMETITAYREALSSDKITNKTAREVTVEKLLFKLNEAPEAEFVVCAFDGVPTGQLKFPM